MSMRADSSTLPSRLDEEVRAMNVVRRIIRPLLPLTLVALVSAACGTLVGAAIGAGSGAAIGAGIDSKNRGRGAANGALIGTGVGAAAGTLYDWTRH
jgi:hypothetical protein